MENEQEIKPGDIVRLKSGSLPMTVGDRENAEGHILCVWSRSDGNVSKEYLPYEVLEKTAE